jgi:hypothetical protein
MFNSIQEIQYNKFQAILREYMEKDEESIRLVSGLLINAIEESIVEYYWKDCERENTNAD